MPQPTRRVAVVLLLMTLLSACTSGQPAPTPTPGATPTNTAHGTPQTDAVITIGFAAQSWERPLYDPLIAQFNAENSTIQVQFIAADEALQPELAQGRAVAPSELIRRIMRVADTASTFFVSQADMNNGDLYNLAPLMDGDAQVPRADVYPAALSAVSTPDGVYALPWSVEVPLVSYNKRLWAARGLAPPDPNWTWNDLLATAAALADTQGDQVNVYGMALDDGSGGVALRYELSSAGIDRFAGSPAPTRLDTPDVQQALARLLALHKSGAIYTAPASENGVPHTAADELQTLIREQRMGIWMNEFWLVDSIEQTPTAFMGTLPFPVVNAPLAAGQVQSYIMSGGTRHPHAAWRWLAFLSDQPLAADIGLARGPGLLPARQSVAERSGYWRDLDAETAAAVQTMLARSNTPPSSDAEMRLTSALLLIDQAFTDSMYRGKAVDAALRAAQSQRDAQLAQLTQTPQPTAAPGPIVVAPPVLQAAPGATTLTFSVGGFDRSAFGAMAQTFNRRNPDLFVQITDPSDTPAAGATFVTTAAQSDCFLWTPPPNRQELTATLKLQPLIAGDATFTLDEYPAALLTSYQHDDDLHGLPYALTLPTLTYHPTLFDAAGLSYPTAAWMTDELRTAAQQLTTGAGVNKQYGYASMLATNDVMGWFRRFGAQVFTDDGVTLQPNFTDATVVQAAHYVVDLWRQTSPHQTIAQYGQANMPGDDAFFLFTRGRVGMLLGLNRSTGFGMESQYAIAPAPLPSGGLSAGDVQSQGLYISATTRHADACWAWVRHLSDQAPLVQGSFPARNSVAESDAFIAQALPGARDVYRAYRDALERGPRDTAQAGEGGPSDATAFWFYRALDRALQGGKLEQELADAHQVTAAYLACVQGAGADAATCARQVDPTYNGFVISP